MSTDIDVRVDAAIMEIAQAFGTRTDKVAPIVDEYGCDLSLAALSTVQAEMRDGYKPSAPFGYMISLLRKGVIQAQAIAEPLDESIETQRKRIHQVLSDPTMDCPMKVIARRPLPAEFAHLQRGESMVKCPCGCHQEFPSAVSG